MNLYNMRNNEALGSINEHQINFLKVNLLKEGESDDDFFITFETIEKLEKSAVLEDEKNIVAIIKESLEKETGRVGLDVYYEEEKEKD